MEFTWSRNIFKNFLINLCKGRVILERILFLNSISPLRVNSCVPKTWVLQVVSKWCSWGEWTKTSAFSLEIQHHGVASVYV